MLSRPSTSVLLLLSALLGAATMIAEENNQAEPTTSHRHRTDTADASSSAPFVATSYGVLRGFRAATADGRPVRVFKKIPFAAAPLGDLRWRLPQPPPRFTGQWDATKYSAACMSNSTETSSPQKEVSEDCLYLNIFIGPSCSAASPCPVIVYIHGGALNYDSAVMFNDSYLINTYASQDVVLAIPAFRLGFTGDIDFGDQEVVPANLGIYDIIQSLRYVRGEISAFSGDPKRLTVLGHSYGASLAAMLAVSPAARAEMPLSRVVSMSGAIRFRPRNVGVEWTNEFTRRANCTRELIRESVDCLRKIAGDELLKIQRQMEEDGWTLSAAVMLPPLFPFKTLSDVFNSAPAIEILMGTTQAEMDLNADYDVRWNGDFVGAKHSKELDDIYLKMNKSGLIRTKHSPQTEEMILSAYLYSKSVVKNGGKAYLYAYEMDKHNEHTDDLSYLMGVHKFTQDENEAEIAKFYPRLFTNFSKYGVPSPLWRPLDDDDSYFSIRVDKSKGRWPETRIRYERATVDFWTKLAPRLDKMIAVAEAAGGRITLDAVTGHLRDIILPASPASSSNSTLGIEEEYDYSAEEDALLAAETATRQAHATATRFWLLLGGACVFLFGYLVGRPGRSRVLRISEQQPLLENRVVRIRLPPNEHRNEYFKRSTEAFVFE